MEQIKPAQYIRLQRKLCHPHVVITAHRLANEWGLTPEEACYRLICETLIKLHEKNKNDKA